MLCDGKAYSRTDPTYAPLFAPIGTKYGAGDGSTTYNVPNLVGCALVSADPTGVRLTTNRPALGAVIGTEAATIAVGELPSHNHTASDGGHAHGVSDPTHAHSVYDPGHAHTQWGADTSFKYGGGQNSTVTFIGSWGGNDHGTAGAGTGISIYGAATGIGINTGYAFNLDREHRQRAAAPERPAELRREHLRQAVNHDWAGRAAFILAAGVAIGIRHRCPAPHSTAGSSEAGEVTAIIYDRWCDRWRRCHLPLAASERRHHHHRRRRRHRPTTTTSTSSTSSSASREKRFRPTRAGRRRAPRATPSRASP